MPSRLALAALLVAASALAGCASGDDGPEAAVDGPSMGILRGVIVDDAIRPLAGVNVSVTPPGGTPVEQTTGEDGLFRFDGLAAGSYSVAATRMNYLSTQTLAQVVAGDPEPALLQLQMALAGSTVPYVNAIVWEGFIGCAFTFGNLCSAPAQAGYDVIGDSSAHLFWGEYVDVERVPDLVQAEAVWEPTLATSEELKPIFGWSEPETWRNLAYQGTFFSESVTSPSFHRIGHAELLDAKVGTESGLVVEFYSGGDTTNPTFLTLNQPIRLVLHNFYGYLPPDAWRFVTDGAPPGP
jgi:hypothetical protein